MFQEFSGGLDHKHSPVLSYPLGATPQLISKRKLIARSLLLAISGEKSFKNSSELCGQESGARRKHGTQRKKGRRLDLHRPFVCTHVYFFFVVYFSIFSADFCFTCFSDVDVKTLILLGEWSAIVVTRHALLKAKASDNLRVEIFFFTCLLCLVVPIVSIWIITPYQSYDNILLQFGRDHPALPDLSKKFSSVV